MKFMQFAYGSGSYILDFLVWANKIRLSLNSCYDENIGKELHTGGINRDKF